MPALIVTVAAGSLLIAIMNLGGQMLDGNILLMFPVLGLSFTLTITLAFVAFLGKNHKELKDMLKLFVNVWHLLGLSARKNPARFDKLFDQLTMEPQDFKRLYK